MKMNPESKNARKSSEMNNNRINVRDPVLESLRNIEELVTKINENVNTLMHEKRVFYKEFLEKHSKDTAKSDTVNIDCKCIKSNCISKTCSCIKKEKECNSSCGCVQTCQNEKLLDPMRPRHELSRTPWQKCQRTFVPHRIQKHEACCKKV